VQDHSEIEATANCARRRTGAKPDCGKEATAELPDKDQIILIYCRRGNRSKDASQKLADMGYTNIYEFGGIETWEGEVVTE
jgi:rhodanese-related sulfurtransferase